MAERHGAWLSVMEHGAWLSVMEHGAWLSLMDGAWLSLMAGAWLSLMAGPHGWASWLVLSLGPLIDWFTLESSLITLESSCTESAMGSKCK